MPSSVADRSYIADRFRGDPPHLRLIRERVFQRAEARRGKPVHPAELNMDVVAIDAALEDGKARLHEAIEEEKRRVIRQIVQDRPGRHQLRVTPQMEKALADLYEEGQRQALTELDATGVQVRTGAFAKKIPTKLDTIMAALMGRLAAIRVRVGREYEQVLASQTAGGLAELSQGAIVREVDRLAPGALDAASRLVSGAFDAGRGDMFDLNSDLIEGWVYSAVMDADTCEECEALDGEEYPDWESIQEVLPDGGPNPNCYGEGRCRCQAVPMAPAEGADTGAESPGAAPLGLDEGLALPGEELIPENLLMDFPEFEPLVTGDVFEGLGSEVANEARDSIAELNYLIRPPGGAVDSLRLHVDLKSKKPLGKIRPHRAAVYDRETKTLTITAPGSSNYTVKDLVAHGYQRYLDDLAGLVHAPDYYNRAYWDRAKKLVDKWERAKGIEKVETVVVREGPAGSFRAPDPKYMNQGGTGSTTGGAYKEAAKGNKFLGLNAAGGGGDRSAAKVAVMRDLSAKLSTNPEWRAALAETGGTPAIPGTPAKLVTKETRLNELKVGDRFKTPKGDILEVTDIQIDAATGETRWFVNGKPAGPNLRVGFEKGDLVDKIVSETPGTPGIPAKPGKKTQLVKNIEAMGAHGTTIDEKAVSYLIDNWARTSADHDIVAIALQHAIADEFGLAVPEFILGRGVAGAAEFYAENRLALRAFVRAMYENTQAKFAAQGIDRIVLYRGQGMIEKDIAALEREGVRYRTSGYYARTKIDLQPASSFSSNMGTATSFIRIDAGSGMIAVEVPVERVLGSAVTGFGCLSEQEFVVLAERAGVHADEAIIVGARQGGYSVASDFWARAEKVLPERKVAVPKVEPPKPPELPPEQRPVEPLDLTGPDGQPVTNKWLNDPGYLYNLLEETDSLAQGDYLVVQPHPWQVGGSYATEGPVAVTKVNFSIVKIELKPGTTKLQADAIVKQRAKKIKEFLDSVDPPELQSALEQITVAQGANPADAYWAKEYSNFTKSAASAGGQQMHFWGGSTSMTQSVFDHELGHLIGSAGGPPDVVKWGASQYSDSLHVKGLGWFTGPKNSVAGVIKPGEPVTSYAANAMSEDWAESVKLYLADKRLGYIYKPPSGPPVRFADIWPGRAKLIEEQIQRYIDGELGYG